MHALTDNHGEFSSKTKPIGAKTRSAVSAAPSSRSNTSIERHGGQLLVRGRVYVRSRELGIRDVPIAWIWEVAGGRFVRGEVFPDPEQAVLRLTGPLSSAP